MIKYILHTDTPNSRSHSNLSKKVGFPARNSTHQHAGKTPISRGFFQWNSDDLLINVSNILQEVFYFKKHVNHNLSATCTIATGTMRQN